MEDIKNNYNNVQEEVQELRKVLQRLKKKFKTSEQEIKDIHRENGGDFKFRVAEAGAAGDDPHPAEGERAVRPTGAEDADFGGN